MASLKMGEKRPRPCSTPDALSLLEEKKIYNTRYTATLHDANKLLNAIKNFTLG